MVSTLTASVAEQLCNKTHTEFTLAAQSLAEQLRRSGIQCLALFADNSPAWVVVDLACQLAKIPLLPLPLFFSSRQLRHAVDDCGADALLTDQPESNLQFFGESVQSMQQMATPFQCWRRQCKSVCLPLGTGKITFTSGSTGQPKGVCLASATQLSVAESLVRNISIYGVRHLCLLPLSTLLENVAGIYAPLLSRGSIIVPPLASLGFSGSSLVDPTKLLTSISHHQPQSIILLPQMLLLLVGAIERGWQAPCSLKFIAVGGARVSQRLLQRARDLGLPVYEGYGLSECGSVVCLNTPQKNRTGTVGNILSNGAITILDGEIVVTENCFLGYVNQPQSWYPTQVPTGDLGQIDADGFVELIGRRKNMLISSFGRNINPEWVESELSADGVLAQVIVVGDARPFCCALIFPRVASMTDQEIQYLIDKANIELPDYARVRRWYRLPCALSTAAGLMTENGRPRRQQITQHFAAQIDRLYQPLSEVQSYEFF